MFLHHTKIRLSYLENCTEEQAETFCSPLKNLCVIVCVCVCVRARPHTCLHACTCAYMYVRAHEGLRLTSGVFLNCSSSSMLGWSQLKLELTHLTSLPFCYPWGCLSPSPEDAGPPHPSGIYMGAQDPNSGPHGSVTSALPSEPSPQARKTSAEIQVELVSLSFL